MQVKKNPKKDSRRWSLIFFQLGLILMLIISWGAIESRSYEKVKKDDDVHVVYTDLAPEDVAVVEHPQQQNTPPPPPPPEAPDKIKIVDDDEDVEETEPVTFEDVEDPDPVQVADISDIQSAPDTDVDTKDIGPVPFNAVSNVPVFPGCEKYSSEAERKKCLSEKVSKFVGRRFNTDIASDLGLTGTQIITTQFVVDKNGDVTDIRAKVLSKKKFPRLEKEAERVVKMLPKMKPGKQRDKAVKVQYTLPIRFRIN